MSLASEVWSILTPSQRRQALAVCNRVLRFGRAQSHFPAEQG
jgi:hypothetical protein